jgi:hypothetical protein
MWLEFETDGAIDENTRISVGMKENRRKSCMLIMYKKAKKLEQMR